MGPEGNQENIRNKKAQNELGFLCVNMHFAEAEGFEPPVPCGTPVFKTGAIDQLCQTSKQDANLDNFFLSLMFGVTYILFRTNQQGKWVN